MRVRAIATVLGCFLTVVASARQAGATPVLTTNPGDLLGGTLINFEDLLQNPITDFYTPQGVTFYGQGRGGIEHTLLCQEGWVVPGAVIAGGDSHTCTLGALGAFGTGLGSTDIAYCLAFGEFWQAVPATIRVEFTGERREFVSGKDLILAVLAEIGVGGGTNAVLEFVGDGAEALSVDERLAVSNMAVEAGAETGIFPADATTAEYLEGRTDRAWSAERSDPDAEFAAEILIDLSTFGPLVALPHLPGNVVPIGEAHGTVLNVESLIVAVIGAVVLVAISRLFSGRRASNRV